MTLGKVRKISVIVEKAERITFHFHDGHNMHPIV